MPEQTAIGFVFNTLLPTVFIVCTYCLAEISGQAAPAFACTNGAVCNAQSDTLRFFILGDFGGLPVYPYTSYAQTAVAKTIAELGDRKKTQFQISLGDNVYFNGVEDEHDSRFEHSFEDVYKGLSMKQPWYMIGGNHDHFGSIAAQVAYSRLSPRWVFPSLYYTVSYEFGVGSRADFVFIDTIVACGNTKDISNAGLIETLFSTSHHPTGPTDPQAAEVQWAWIERQLNYSRADYLFVAGHYPVYSIAEHGPTQCLVDRLKPLLHKYKVSAYLSGHDHNVQHLSESANDATVEYVVSGAASRSDRSTNNERAVPDGALRFHYPTGWNPFATLGFTNGAFVYAELSPAFAQFNFYSGSGTNKYQFTIPPRRR